MRLNSNALARARYKAGFATAKDAADALGVTVTTLSAVENGSQMPGDELLERMAGRYGLERDRLKLMAVRTSIRRLSVRLHHLQFLANTLQGKLDDKNLVDNDAVG